MPGKEITSALWIQIANNKVCSVSGHRFFPPSSLSTIFTQSAIGQAVEELVCGPEEKIGLTEHISKNATVIFAILVWMKVEDSIVVFRNHGIVDASLPLDVNRAKMLSPSFGATFAQEYQWQFDPYIFPANMADHHWFMDSERILPFTLELPLSTSGGFSRVSLMEIHPSMQKFDSQADSIKVIRKHLQRRGDQEAYDKLFKHEMKCLRLLNRRKHPCIISLLGSYTQRNEHYFLFPRFELDLNQFFSLEHATQKFEQLSTSLSALRGLASALCTLHELHLTSVEHGLEFEAIGYHHDLRPANILVGQETFVLADFGLGKLKPANEVSETAWKAGAGDYLAPECMNENFDHQNVGRSIDVWAFACLMAEVLVFTLQGRLGLIQFREARLHESPDSQWTNSYFYGQSGDSRPSVRQWLKVLQRHGCLQGCAQLILEALVKDPEKRPDMSRIHDHLSFFSLQAQHGLVCDNLTNVLSSMGPRTEYPPSAMKIWFERERLQAIGHALWLDNAGDIDSIPIIEETLHNHCLTKLTDIHERILRFNHECRTGTPSTRDPRMKNEVDTENSIISDLSASDMSSAHGLAGDLTELVQSIWCVLPSARLQMVEMQWVRRILESDDTQELGKVQRGLSFINPPRIYETSAALAMMKTVRLEILSNPLFDDYKNKLIANDVIFTGSFSGHETGLYERSTPVLLERMFYSPTWESVSSTQRAIVMSLKAKSFGYTPKPEGLRVLDCIGFYEEKGSNAGYVFTYRIPPQISQSPINPKPTTLSKLLLVSAKHAQKDPYCRQPLLEDKFHLAHILASFLMNFHGIGWLHENFHPKNIVFFKSPENNGSIDTSTSSIIREPYVVGLHKSRPGGESWHTEGPAQDLEAINYINPRYTQTKRFSVLDDYYSLGIMLLEIGLWYPSNVWSQKDESRRKLSPMALRDLFLKQYVPRLGPRMGSTYRSVVEICLTDGLDDGAIHATSEAKSQSIVNSFIEKVVYPLARLVIPSAGGKVTM